MVSLCNINNCEMFVGVTLCLLKDIAMILMFKFLSSDYICLLALLAIYYTVTMVFFHCHKS